VITATDLAILTPQGLVQRAAMPTVLRLGGFRFFFFSQEGSEPPHIHVEHAENYAKFWLDPVFLASSHGFRTKELTVVRELVVKHRVMFLEKWNEHFGRQL